MSKFSDMFELKLKFCQLYKLLKEYKEFSCNRDIPQINYLCEICDNIIFMAKALNQNSNSSRQVLANPHNIVEAYYSSSSVCMNSECETCKCSGLSMNDCKTSNGNISIQEWKRIQGQINKHSKSVSMEDAIKLFNEHLVNLKRHIHVKKMENAEFSRIKDSLHSKMRSQVPILGTSLSQFLQQCVF